MTTRRHAHSILTLPNLLSMARIAMIPAIVLTFVNDRCFLSAAFLVLSGLTDVADGWLARRYGWVSDAGKVLDPVADKLTLAAATAMLIKWHPELLVLFVLLCLRETVMGLTGLASVIRTRSIQGALWHGKITTAAIYATAFLHLLWQDIPAIVTNIMIIVCSTLLLTSMLFYTRDNIRRIRCGTNKGE